MIDHRAIRRAQMIAHNLMRREHHADGDSVGTNDLGGPSPESLIDAQPTPERGWLEDALSRAKEYSMPRMEDYQRGVEGPAALTQAGIENMKSGDWRRMLAGAGQDILGTISTPFAPIAGAVEAAKGSAERTFGPAAGHAVDVASMVNPDVLPLTIGKAGSLVGHYGPEIAIFAGPMAKTADLEQFKFKTIPSKPTSYEDNYTLAIRMLELSVEEIIDVEENIFNQLVLDEWGWKQQFTTLSASYKSV